MRIAVLCDSTYHFAQYMREFLPDATLGPEGCYMYGNVKFVEVSRYAHLRGRDFDYIIDIRELSRNIISRVYDSCEQSELSSICYHYERHIKTLIEEINNETHNVE